MDRTHTIRLVNRHAAAKEHVYVSVFWDGGSRTFGPLTLASNAGEVANVLPANFSNPITSMRLNWTVNGQPRRQDVKAQNEYFFASFVLEWEPSGRRQVTFVECQTQEMMQVETTIK